MALARIYRPSKTAMQSGRAQTRNWLLEYEPATRRDPDPLMGWSSARDTLNEVGCTSRHSTRRSPSPTKHGLDLRDHRAARAHDKPKSYADNFRYDRIST
jgi:hypothetical protein